MRLCFPPEGVYCLWEVGVKSGGILFRDIYPRIALSNPGSDIIAVTVILSGAKTSAIEPTRKNNTFRDYYKSGELKTIYSMKGNIKQGKAVMYYKNGNIRKEMNNANDSLTKYGIQII